MQRKELKRPQVPLVEVKLHFVCLLFNCFESGLFSLLGNKITEGKTRSMYKVNVAYGENLLGSDC